MTESQVSEAPAPEEIRFRSGFWQRVMPMLSMTVFMGFDTVLWAVTGVGRPMLFDARFIALWTVLAVVMAVVSPFGITLTSSAAKVHNLRPRTIPWASVQNVCVERVTGGWVIALYESDGRRTRLRAPFTGFLQRDRRFEEKFHVIGQWWQTHRGSDWVALPPPRTAPSFVPLTPGHPAAPGVPAAPPVPPAP
ncbi:hypothetical protein ABZ153_10065 [Streptomyces sp. NPDC006290]|uniref:hypothetical protein n=1 Tax=Streptomyces sp. NPDC006290 TaxID=3156745 RepID=UPI0033B2A2EF